MGDQPTNTASLPPPPPGFVLDGPSSSGSSLPPPPAGFVVDNNNSSLPPPPSGFVLDQPAQQAAPTSSVKPPDSAGIVKKMLDTAKEGYTVVGDVAEGTKKFLDNIVGYKASDAAKDHMAKGYSAIKDGNVSEAQFHLRSAAEDIVENHPLSELLKAQWDSSMRNLEATKEAMKKKDHLSTVQHAAGIMPVASIVSDAMDKAVADPTLHNIMHAVVTGGLALLPGAMKGMSKAGDLGAETETAPLANTAEDEAANEPPTSGTNTGVSVKNDASVTHVYDPATGEIKPIMKADKVAAKNTAKAGLAPGEEARTVVKPGTPATESVEETAPTSPPTGTMHEAILQHGIRTQLNRVAAEEGLEQIPADTDIREVAHNLSDQFYNRSKAGFDAVKEATGVDVNFLRDQILDAQDKLSLVFGDPDREGAIIERINTLNDEAVKAMEEAKKAGVDVKQPLSDWAKSKQASDIQQDLRASTDPHQKIGTLDPGKWVQRVEKRYRSDPRYTKADPRLQQLVGKEGAEAIRDDAYTADEVNEAIKKFKPEPGSKVVTKTPGTPDVETKMPATESKALFDLIRKNTNAKWSTILRTRSNWIKTYEDFQKIPEDVVKTQFRNPQEVESFLHKKAVQQKAMNWAKGAGIVGGVGYVAHEVGVDRSFFEML